MNATSTSLATLKNAAAVQNVEIGFGTAEGFGTLQRIATMFAQSSLVPKAFQGNIANCCIAVEMAIRMGMSPLMACQNLYIVHGTPSWSSSFLIACFNQCGRFTPIQYRFEGTPHTDDWGCRAVAKYAATGEEITGTLVTIGMAKKEGWYSKTGSKWQTMPEQMLRYRAAAWMIRSTAPEIGMGFHTSDEIVDLGQSEDGTYTIVSSEIQPKEHVQVEIETAQQEPTEDEQSTTSSDTELEQLRAKAQELYSLSGIKNPFSCAPFKWNKKQCEVVIERSEEALRKQESEQAEAAHVE